MGNSHNSSVDSGGGGAGNKWIDRTSQYSTSHEELDFTFEQIVVKQYLRVYIIVHYYGFHRE